MTTIYDKLVWPQNDEYRHIRYNLKRKNIILIIQSSDNKNTFPFLKEKEKWANASTSGSRIKKYQCPQTIHKDAQIISINKNVNLNKINLFSY